MKTKLTFVALFFAALWPFPGRAQPSAIPPPKIQKFSVPGAAIMFTGPINSQGSVAGSYEPTFEDPFSVFLRSASGVVSTVVIPDVAGTSLIFADGLSAAGVVSGYFEAEGGLYDSFLWQSGSPAVIFQAPGAGTDLTEGTFATTANASGIIAGYFIDQAHVLHGFLRYPNGSFAVVDAPGAGSSPSYGTEILAINDQGSVTGYYIDAQGEDHGFARNSAGVFEFFDSPVQPGGLISPSGINASGEITGSYICNGFESCGFRRTQFGAMMIFSVQGADTFPISISDPGIISGYWELSSDVSGGFREYDRGTVTTFEAGESETTVVTGGSPNGLVAGYFYGGTANEGFVLTP